MTVELRNAARGQRGAQAWIEFAWELGIACFPGRDHQLTNDIVATAAFDPTDQRARGPGLGALDRRIGVEQVGKGAGMGT